MNTEKAVDVLNRLIEINNDRIEGYETAYKETEEFDLKRLFNVLIETSQKCRAELLEELTRLGGTPIEGTKISGKFFRVWMDVKAAISGKDRKTILSLCEYGEDVAVATYEDALADDIENISSEQRAIILKQHHLIKADHDEIKSLRDHALEHS